MLEFLNPARLAWVQGSSPWAPRQMLLPFSWQSNDDRIKIEDGLYGDYPPVALRRPDGLFSAALLANGEELFIEQHVIVPSIICHPDRILTYFIPNVAPPSY